MGGGGGEGEAYTILGATYCRIVLYYTNYMQSEFRGKPDYFQAAL